MASGALKTKRLRDWQVIKLSVPTVTEKLPEDVELDFVVRSDQRAPVPIGLPLFRPVAERASAPPSVDGVPLTDGGMLGLQISYERS